MSSASHLASLSSSRLLLALRVASATTVLRSDSCSRMWRRAKWSTMSTPSAPTPYVCSLARTSSVLRFEVGSYSSPSGLGSIRSSESMIISRSSSTTPASIRMRRGAVVRASSQTAAAQQMQISRTRDLSPTIRLSSTESPITAWCAFSTVSSQIPWAPSSISLRSPERSFASCCSEHLRCHIARSHGWSRISSWNFSSVSMSVILGRKSGSRSS
mmetsp:Transcript_22464/g.69717  ORF Transcript_22464/g.69717 Transcript_22464/m.69717 type:complete len:215 (+) Transcript_22464:1260-1904(+)